MVRVGDTVTLKSGKTSVWGEVAKVDGDTAFVALLPDFLKHSETGTVRTNKDDLVPTKVCECAKLGYRPQHGDDKGKLFTTGCDFSRRPGRGSNFLPGHDAKAKGFLIRAASETSTLENGLGALETARLFGDKIETAVAKGINKARENDAKRTLSRHKGAQRDQVATPAQREDRMDDVDRLVKKLGISDAMFRAMAQAIVRDTPGFLGCVSGPTGTLLALQERGLTSWEALTDLGYKVMRTETLSETNPEAIKCRDEEGAYEEHAPKWDREEFVQYCRRCNTEIAHRN